jgi:fatty acid desaturase
MDLLSDLLAVALILVIVLLALTIFVKLLPFLIFVALVLFVIWFLFIDKVQDDKSLISRRNSYFSSKSKPQSSISRLKKHSNLFSCELLRFKVFLVRI